jgi:hypothetical protein
VVLFRTHLKLNRGGDSRVWYVILEDVLLIIASLALTITHPGIGFERVALAFTSGTGWR